MNRRDRRLAARGQGKPGSAPAGRMPDQAAAKAELLTAARTLHDEGRFSEAAELCKRVLALDGQDAEAHFILASMLLRLGHYAAARACVDQLIAFRPADHDAWLLLALLLLRMGDMRGALDACRKALEIAPALPDAHMMLGNVMAAERRFDQAELSFRRALALKPGSADAAVNLGSALFYQGRVEEAEVVLRRTLAQDPRHIYGLRNLAASLRGLGRFQEALATYRAAIAIAPNFAEARKDEALLLLLLGQFEEGWSKYEWRLNAPIVGAPAIPGPRWRGESVAGRTILLQSEQGFGDAIQFLRYVPMIVERGGNVVLRLPSSLTGLCGSAISASSRVAAFEEPMPHYDYQASLLSLPNIFATNLETIPCPIRYLCPPPGWAEHWQRNIGSFAGIRVGIAWAGNPVHENDHIRSIKFSYFLPLLTIESVRFYSLQVGERSSDLSVADGSVIDLSASLVDFGATAGIIDVLDLVITVDTAVAHLAGALGKPVWLLLPFIPDWRWLLERDDSPWYPSMRLFRQKARGDWSGVIARVAKELEELALVGTGRR